MTVRRWILVSSFVAAAAVGVAADDWPQWRGPHRDGLVASRLTGTWPEKLVQKWRVTVGEGHSSPVVSGDRVFIHARQGESEVVRALEVATGREIWKSAEAVPYEMNPAARGHGKGPKSTPLVLGGRLFTLGITGSLTAYDLQTGRTAWRKTFRDEFPDTAPSFGTGMSPMAESGLVIVHVGGHDRGAMLAVDPGTGAVKWRWTGDGPAYASPIVVESGGVRQLITQTERFLVGLDARSGQLLWREPFTTSYDQNAVTPVAWKDVVIFSGLDKGVFALRPVVQSGKWRTEQVWDARDVSLYMNSPVVSGNHLFGFSHRNKGQLFMMDVATGRTLWTSAPRQGDNAAIIADADLVFVLTTEAELLVARPSVSGSAASVDVIRRYELAETATWAHPVVLPTGVLVKDAESLTFWQR